MIYRSRNYKLIVRGTWAAALLCCLSLSWIIARAYAQQSGQAAAVARSHQHQDIARPNLPGERGVGPLHAVRGEVLHLIRRAVTRRDDHVGIDVVPEGQRPPLECFLSLCHSSLFSFIVQLVTRFNFFIENSINFVFKKSDLLINKTRFDVLKILIIPQEYFQK